MSITPRKTKTGKTYYFVRVKAGRDPIASKAFDTKREAEAWERDQKHRLETGLPLAPKRSFTLQQLVDEFLASRAGGNPHTVDTDRNGIAALPVSLLRRPLSSIHSGDIRSHLTQQLERKKPSTVAREKTTLSALFTFASEQGLLHQPHPVRTMKRIPELGATAQRAISPKDVPSATRLNEALARIRARRADVADVFEFMALTGIRWGEARALRVDALAEIPFAQLVVTRSHSDRYEEKETKTWRGTRTLPLSPRALEIFRLHSFDKAPDEYLFTNQVGRQLSVGVVNKFPLGFERHSLRHFAASTWLRLGTPIHEVAEYLGDDSRTVLAVYAHILGEGQRRAHAQRLALAETENQAGDTWGTPGANSAAKPAVTLLKAERGN
ncbi:MAG TPA: tyrosine-type recombinase/integrase [Microbacterium sp.]|uniref:tyrosine-type recombinase/integrase n=1 Tax=Microbacterium sp. TaxID=51671 RepID=UPI002B49AAF5|nr:tyrosine-type recombinase/integrase [Microbacterium sp.]HKT55664.1 tyrosine-type recombinase/integrase [Microbacterium sp.]